MAKVKLGPMAGQISGSIGGTVFAHNRGGAYIRARSSVDKHHGVKSREAHAVLAAYSAVWARIGDDHRSAWTEWARQNPVTDSLGEQRPLDGHQAYVSLSARLGRLGVSAPETPPTVMAPEPLITCSLAAIHASTITLTFTASLATSGLSLWIQAALVNSAGVAYIKNYLSLMKTYTGPIAGSKVITSDFTALCGPVAVGQYAHVWVQVINNTNGLISQPMRAVALVS